jgi:hypothetical protein
VETLQSIASAKTSNVLDAVRHPGAPLSTADEFLHGFSLLVSLSEVSFAGGLPHQF